MTIFETTSEVKVSTTAFSAQNGVGNIINNKITKRGTDKFHGAVHRMVNPCRQKREEEPSSRK